MKNQGNSKNKRILNILNLNKTKDKKVSILHKKKQQKPLVFSTQCNIQTKNQSLSPEQIHKNISIGKTISKNRHNQNLSIASQSEYISKVSQRHINKSMKKMMGKTINNICTSSAVNIKMVNSIKMYEKDFNISETSHSSSKNRNIPNEELNPQTKALLKKLEEILIELKRRKSNKVNQQINELLKKVNIFNTPTSNLGNFYQKINNTSINIKPLKFLVNHQKAKSQYVKDKYKIINKLNELDKKYKRISKESAQMKEIFSKKLKNLDEIYHQFHKEFSKIKLIKKERKDKRFR